MKSFVFIPFLFFALVLNAQPGRNRSVLHQVSNKDLVQSVFPEAVKVSKINDYWFSVVDSKGMLCRASIFVKTSSGIRRKLLC